MPLTKTPYFDAAAYRPTMPGPFECRSKHAPEDGPTHMRWWNGVHWSLPLDVDPADYDGLTAPPPLDWPERDWMQHESYLTFVWRGYNEDADPL